MHRTLVSTGHMHYPDPLQRTKLYCKTGVLNADPAPALAASAPVLPVPALPVSPEQLSVAPSPPDGVMASLEQDGG